MTPTRFAELTSRYAALRIAIVGDFCLDRYLEIDPARAETSIETHLPVHNVVNVRAQPGAAGTILNNLCALGIGEIHPLGFCGHDGEGSELLAALRARPGVQLEHFVTTPERRTFTYCKPLVLESGRPPRELNRLDSKNWTPTPPAVESALVAGLERVAERIDAVIVLDQVDVAETGVVTRAVRACLGRLQQSQPKLTILADSRRGLGGFPPLTFKMNRAELGALVGGDRGSTLDAVKAQAALLAQRNGQPVFVTLAEEGIVGATPEGGVEHRPTLPIRGPIDIVGAGDAVTANLTAALATGATTVEAIELANAGASVVIHQLGTTGTASVNQLRELMA